MNFKKPDAHDKMMSLLNTPFSIGALQLPSRLIQGPLAGFSCAPFRELFTDFLPPAYCVTEMMSARDVIDKHLPSSRYLYRSPREKILCYQLSGNDPLMIAAAAARVESMGADLVDLNVGCPKPKIRKKGAGSALLEDEQRLVLIIEAVRRNVTIPLTVKIRLQDEASNVRIAKAIERAGADALIVHGRRWTDDYDIPCDKDSIAAIKQTIQIPVIANGDVSNQVSLLHLMQTGCDAYMISRAGTGNPWLYQQLLGSSVEVTDALRQEYFRKHLEGLKDLEDEHRAVLQSRKLFRYYFRGQFSDEAYRLYCAIPSLEKIDSFLKTLCR